MAEVRVNLSGEAYAKHLAVNLTDLEFELLIRARITRMFTIAQDMEPNLDDSHFSVTFTQCDKDRDGAKWEFTGGVNWSKRYTAKGAVLSMTMKDALYMYTMAHANVLSVLLPAPSVDIEMGDAMIKS